MQLLVDHIVKFHTVVAPASTYVGVDTADIERYEKVKWSTSLNRRSAVGENANCYSSR
jgi:hypothetical protein